MDIFTIGDWMISGIIMASGFSRRMKRDKLLMKINNKQIIKYVIEAAKESNLDEIILVYRREEIKNIGKNYNIKTIYNEKAHLGQCQSIIKGIEEARGSGYMFLAGDQPFINYILINKLIEE